MSEIDVEQLMKSAARSYLIWWAAVDRQAMAMLNDSSTPDDDIALLWLELVATNYGVTRNFPANLGDDRYKRLWEELKSITLSGNTFADFNRFFERLQKHYGKKLTSAASKFLWMRFKCPFIIYDTFAYEWVHKGQRFRNKYFYEDYSNAWRQLFNKVSVHIDQACNELISSYARLIPRSISAAEVESAVTSQWFKERVFDQYCVTRGAEILRQKKSR